MMSEAMTARLKPVQPGRASLVSVLDLGSTKMCCLIARLSPMPEQRALKGRSHIAEVLGFGYGPSAGIKAGGVTNLDEAEQALRSVVGMAERMAGVTVESIIVNVSSGRLGSETYNASVSLDGHAVEPADLSRVLNAVNARSVRDDRAVMHALPIGYALDGHGGIKDPKGMVGETLGVDVAVVSAETLAMRNIELLLNRCHLQAEAFVATPYASGLSSLVDDESELGVCAIDMGGATTSVAVFRHGTLVYADSIAMGGQNITLDIARQLSISIADAERLKTMHASVLPGPADERELVSIQPIGTGHEDQPIQINKSVLTRIVRPRVEEMLTLISDRLQATTMMDVCGRRFVVTGGASELTGLPEMARRVLARNVRQGRPLGVSGLPVMAKGAGFSAAVGMLIYPQVCEHELSAAASTHAKADGTGYFARIAGWLRANL